MSDIKIFNREKFNNSNQARLISDYILDSDGHRVTFNDPRIVYVYQNLEIPMEDVLLKTYMLHTIKKSGLAKKQMLPH